MLTWTTLINVDQLEQIDADSHSNVQLIFKHSTTCPISYMAKNRVEANWNLSEVTAHYLDLKVYRDVSAAIADRYGVQHESPQIIAIKNGKAIYNESHLDISVEEIASKLAAVNA